MLTAPCRLIGGRGGGVYSHIHVLHDDFFSNQIKIEQFEFDLKETRHAEHEYMNIYPPPPIVYLCLM